MIDRRRFLASTSASAATLASLGSASSLHAAEGAAEPKPPRLRVGQIGVRGRGVSHLQALGNNAVAICEVDSQIAASRAAEHAKRVGVETPIYSSHQEMFERGDIQAVSIATPNHTHVWLAIEAMEAGLDVYVEKPVSHNVWEGRQLVAAAKKHGRIVQCGMQSRSSPSLAAAAAWVQGGAMGAIQYAIGTCYKPRKPIGKLETPLSIPGHIDYDLWCGPAEKVDLYRPELHYDWHWDWNTGNGDMGNQGIHQMDIARWFLGESGLAPRTVSIGGRLGYSDAGNTPNTQVVLHDYPTAPLIFETRGLPRSKAAQKDWGASMDRYRGSGIGVLVQCEEGHVVIPSYVEAYAYNRSGELVKEWKGGGNHFTNWLDAVEARDNSLLNAPAHDGHVSSALCHTGGVSQLLAEPLPAVEIAAQFKGDPLLSQSLDRMFAHLRANDVDIDGQELLSLGPWLDVDTASERFVGNEAAEPLWRRTGRKGYEVADYGA